jgi:hypothetical protein
MFSGGLAERRLKMFNIRSTMKLVNKTEWSTKDLRKICLAGIKANGVNQRGYRVEVSYQKGKSHKTNRQQCFVGGRGYIQIPVFKLFMWGPQAYADKKMMPLSADEMRGLAGTINHEIWHNQGLHHRDMYNCLGAVLDREESSPEKTAWAKDLTLRPKEKRIVTRKARSDVKREHAEKMLSRASRRLKTAKTIFAKWQRKVKYYRGRLEVAAKE